MKDILIYLDDGVGDRARIEVPKELERIVSAQEYRVKGTTAEELGRPDWIHSTAMLVIPGGADVPYDRKLRGTPNLHIRMFVEGGGAYLGLCAGAYYGSAKVAFDVSGPLEVHESRELVFFPGVACGPAFGPYSYLNEGGARAALIEWQLPGYSAHPSRLRVYFNGGCFFHDAEKFSEVYVAARFGEIPGNPAAIVLCKVGNGRALLCGVHPEYSHTALSDKDPYLRELLPLLTNEEKCREVLLQSMLSSIGITCSDQ